MTENKRFGMIKSEISGLYVPIDEQKSYNFFGLEDEYDCMRIVDALNNLYDMKVENGKIASAYLKENEQLKQELKRCRNWLNSDKNDYELTLAFIKNKGYSLKDVLEYEKELKSE